ncbi:MAG: hypothetical protein ACKVOE_08960 [Rickettsiales bacterium]
MMKRDVTLLLALGVLLAGCASLSEKGKGLNAFDSKSFWCSGKCGGDDDSDGADDADTPVESSHGGDSGSSSGDSGGN